MPYIDSSNRAFANSHHASTIHHSRITATLLQNMKKDDERRRQIIHILETYVSLLHSSNNCNETVYFFYFWYLPDHSTITAITQPIIGFGSIANHLSKGARRPGETWNSFTKGKGLSSKAWHTLGFPQDVLTYKTFFGNGLP